MSGHEKAVTSVSFHASNNSIISCSNDGSILLWNLQNEQVISRLKLVEKPIRDCMFAVGSKKILGVFDKNYLKTWEMGDNGFLASLKDHQKLIIRVIDKLEAIIEVVEKHEEAVMDLYGDTHLIQIWGEKEVMNKLIKRQLVEKEESFWS